MQIEFTNEEVSLVLDGLAQLPLARTYNLFQRVLAAAQTPVAPPPVMTPIQEIDND